MDQKILTQEYLKSLLYYSIISGKFYWNRSKGSVQVNSIAGYRHHNRYRRIRIDGKDYLSHRLAFLYVLGRFPKKEIDHINHDADDNRWMNLRECTHHENSKNKKLNANNTSGVTGVCFNKAIGKWQAQVGVKGKLVYLGLYQTKEKAIQVREKSNIDYDFHPKHGA